MSEVVDSVLRKVEGFAMQADEETCINGVCVSMAVWSEVVSRFVGDVPVDDEGKASAPYSKTQFAAEYLCVQVAGRSHEVYVFADDDLEDDAVRIHFSGSVAL